MSTQHNVCRDARRWNRPASILTLFIIAAVALPAQAQSRGDRKESGPPPAKAAATPQTRGAPAPKATLPQAAPRQQPTAEVRTAPASRIQAQPPSRSTPSIRQQPAIQHQPRPTPSVQTAAQPTRQAPAASQRQARPQVQPQVTPPQRTRPTAPVIGPRPSPAPQQTTQPSRRSEPRPQLTPTPDPRQGSAVAPTRQRPSPGLISRPTPSTSATSPRETVIPSARDTYAPSRSSSPAIKEWQPRERPGAHIPRGGAGLIDPPQPQLTEFSRPLQRNWENSGAALRERYATTTPGVGALVPSAEVHHYHHYPERRRHRSSLSIHIGFGSYWGYPYWYHRPWHWYDPWCGPVVYHRPYRYYRPVYWWDCDPWPHYSSTVFVSAGSSFAFSTSSSVRYVYSSSYLIPSAVCHEPAYVSSIIYTPPPVVVASPSVTYFQSAPTQTIAAEPLPAPTTEAELRAVTDRQLGDTYLRLGDFESAIRVYTAHTNRHPGDAQALRTLGVALIADGDVAIGVSIVERAYRIDPTLAQRPLAMNLLDQRVFESVLDRTTRNAAESNVAAAWLTVAALMQAQGHSDAARAAVDRARTAGLDELVWEWMASENPAQPRQ